MEILVFNEKHGQRFLPLCPQAFLKVVKERHASGDWYYPVYPAPDHPEINLEEVPKSLQREAKRKLEDYQKELRWHQEEVRMFDLLQKAVGQNDEGAAEAFCRLRQNYEYEGFDIEEIESVPGFAMATGAWLDRDVK